MWLLSLFVKSVNKCVEGNYRLQSFSLSLSLSLSLRDIHRVFSLISYNNIRTGRAESLKSFCILAWSTLEKVKAAYFYLSYVFIGLLGAEELLKITPLTYQDSRVGWSFSVGFSPQDTPFRLDSFILPMQGNIKNTGTPVEHKNYSSKHIKLPLLTSNISLLFHFFFFFFPMHQELSFRYTRKKYPISSYIPKYRQRCNCRTCDWTHVVSICHSAAHQCPESPLCPLQDQNADVLFPLSPEDGTTALQCGIE